MASAISLAVLALATIPAVAQPRQPGDVTGYAYGQGPPTYEGGNYYPQPFRPPAPFFQVGPDGRDVPMVLPAPRPQWDHPEPVYMPRGTYEQPPREPR